MENYHVVYGEHGWEIKGARRVLHFDIKKDAVEEAKKIAQTENKSVVIHALNGSISSVVSNGRRYAKGRRIKSANVKRRLSGKSVRNSIAKAMAKRG